MDGAADLLVEERLAREPVDRVVQTEGELSGAPCSRVQREHLVQGILTLPGGRLDHLSTAKDEAHAFERPASMDVLLHDLEAAIRATLAPLYPGSVDSLLARAAATEASATSTVGLRPRQTVPETIVGAFEGEELIEFLQMLGLYGRSGILAITTESQQGTLELDKGHIVCGALGDLRGLPAARAVIQLPKGEFEFTIGGETKTLGQGDAYVIPGGVEHSLVGNDGWSLALDIFSPPREEYKS